MTVTTGLHDRSRGLRIEACLIKEYGWKKSTQRENIVDDIDAYSSKGTSISIKSISARTFRSGNLAFELEVEHAGNGWVPSWFQKGKAQKYVFHIEDHGVYVLDKKELVCYIEKHGWDRVARHRPETRAKQIALGHPHTDAKVGLIKLATLITAGIAKPLKRGLHCK
jgi:hypothetical protein